MEDNITPKNIQMYTSWRDDFLNIIGEETCKECADPRKEGKNINYENPLDCECRCHRVEKMLTAAANIDAEIKQLEKGEN